MQEPHGHTEHGPEAFVIPAPGTDFEPPPPRQFPGTEPIEEGTVPFASDEPVREKKPSWASRRAAKKATAVATTTSVAEESPEAPMSANMKPQLPWDTRIKIAVVLSFVILVTVLILNRGPRKAGKEIPVVSIGNGAKKPSLPSSDADKDDAIKKASENATEMPVESPPRVEDRPEHPSASPPGDIAHTKTKPGDKVSAGASPRTQPEAPLDPSGLPGEPPRPEPLGHKPANTDVAMATEPAVASEVPPIPEDTPGTKKTQAVAAADKSPFPAPPVAPPAEEVPPLPDEKPVPPPVGEAPPPLIQGTLPPASPPVTEPEPAPKVTPQDTPPPAAPVTPASSMPVLSTPPSAPETPTETPSVAPNPGAQGQAGYPIPNAGLKRTASVASISGAPASAVVPPARSTRISGDAEESSVHVVTRGENFWTISRYYYGSGRFYKALWYANRDQAAKPEDLYVGTVIRIPAVQALNRTMIEPTRTVAQGGVRAAEAGTRNDAKAERASTSGEDVVVLRASDAVSAGKRKIPIESGIRPPPRRSLEPSYRTHVVVARNETLRSVARKELGNSDRAGEILELNEGLEPDVAALPVGLTLKIPAETQRR